MLNEVPAAVKHELGSPAVQCEPQAPPDLLKKDELANQRADVKELELLSRKPGGDEASCDVECAGQLRVRTGDEAYDILRVVGTEFGLGWSDRASRCAKPPIEVLGRFVVLGTDHILPYFGSAGGVGRCGH